MLLEPGKHTIFAKCACCEGPPRNTVVSATLIQAQSRGKSARPRPQDTLLQPMFGEWLSLVEHLVRDQGVGGSNPLSPTILFNHIQTYNILESRPSGISPEGLVP